MLKGKGMSGSETEKKQNETRLCCVRERETEMLCAAVFSGIFGTMPKRRGKRRGGGPRKEGEAGVTEAMLRNAYHSGKRKYIMITRAPDSGGRGRMPGSARPGPGRSAHTIAPRSEPSRARPVQCLVFQSPSTRAVGRIWCVSCVTWWGSGVTYA